MSAHTLTLATLREDQVEEAGLVIAHAFQDYPLLIYGFPDPDERARVAAALLTWNVRHGLMFGKTYGTGTPLTGAAILFPPGGDAWADDRLQASGFDQLGVRVGTKVMERLVMLQGELFAYGDADLHQTVTEPHWYIDAIGIHPAHQGRGLGGLFIEAIHAELDPTGLPIALLTHDPKTVPFYLRHGYALVCQGQEPTSSLRHWGLLRPAVG
jgi:GNAT superfamily N-acetyltransferase